MIKNFIIIASVTANFSFLFYFYKNFNDGVSTYSKPELSPASTMSTTLLSKNNVIQTPSAIVPEPKIAAADTVALPEIWESENYASLADLLRSQSYPEDLVRQIV